jgi:hypothetical protein
LLEIEFSPAALCDSVFKKMKEHTQKRVDDWDEALDPAGKKIHQVNSLMFLRIEDVSNPWSLKEMTDKLNLIVDFIEPKKFMLTPRKGMFDPKKHYQEWGQSAEVYVRQTAWWARQAGCDTVIMVVPGSAITEMGQALGVALDDVSPCSLASFGAEAPDGATTSDALKWKFFKHSNLQTLKQLKQQAIPPFSGQITPLLQPDPDKDPSKAPQHKWAAFPDPPAEVLPPDYPDLPAFSSCFEAPVPAVPKRKPKQ